VEKVLERTIEYQSELGSLVAASRDGDRDAFCRLVRPHLCAALATASVIAGSHADGADAMQNALLAAWQGIGTLREPDAFPAWFRRLVVRAAVDVARRRRHVLEVNLAIEWPGTDLEDLLDRRRLRRAFNRLAPKDRVVLALRHVWDLPGAEMAIQLGVPEGTVKSRVHAALRRLRAAYEAEDRR
jgi:RNA polymerase sigma factor (sigma-70 family)